MARIALLAAILIAVAACTASLPEGWTEEKGGPRHLGTGLACPRDFMNDTMALDAFGPEKVEAEPVPFCAFSGGDGVRVKVFVLGRHEGGEVDYPRVLKPVRALEKEKNGLDPLGEIYLESGAGKTLWAGVAYDPSNGGDKEPLNRTYSAAAINGWLVRLDLTYRMRMKTIDGVEQLTAPAVDIRNAVTDHLAASLKKV